VPVVHGELDFQEESGADMFEFAACLSGTWKPRHGTPLSYVSSLKTANVESWLTRPIPRASSAPTSTQEFAQLAERWKAETAHLSLVTKAAMHPAYQRIIGLGPAALPLILRELRDEPRQWFWALKAISGEDPVGPADRGNVSKMREAWLAWGMAHGHIR
jgi:hypothetical protein